nr:class I SAM-dependent methyltransferase [Bradyrhizobium yuanmingense]
MGGEPVSSDDELRNLYQTRLAELGFCPEMMFYRDKNQHELKLLAIAEQLRLLQAGAPMSLLEIGCGYGELARFYTSTGDYLGIDIVPEFVSEAKERNPGLSYMEKSAFETDISQFDVCVLPGVLSGVPDSPGLLKRALQLSRRYIVFDVTLSNRLPSSFSSLFRWDSNELASLLNGEGFASVRVLDMGRSWVVLTASRVTLSAVSPSFRPCIGVRRATGDGSEKRRRTLYRDSPHL